MIWLFFVSSFIFAQPAFLKEAAAKFDKALVEKDTVILKQIVHKDLSYGHSNAWVQTKNDLIQDLFNGKISYKQISSKDFIWTVGKDWATVRSTVDVEFIIDDKEGKLHLHVLQVWLKTNKGWQLLARQSTKL
ncbi:MAG: nuclear transport factor 2 family protein [Chitinophagaceae bacterium]|nr:nuclear transport factor 2 family protein [Chitinophagaceae bacterium]